jgi:hypothetical protein
MANDRMIALKVRSSDLQPTDASHTVVDDEAAPAITVRSSASAVDPSFTIVRSNAAIAGESVSQWTGDWWTWALQSPANQNPLLDQTGAFANVNNNGPVFFIAGDFGGDVERSFTVPAGKPLLVPLLNAFDVEGPGIAPTIPGWKGTFEAEVNKALAGFQNGGGPNGFQPGVSSVFATIDGVPVKNPQSYLEKSGFFSMGPVQPGSLIESFGLADGTVLSPTKSVGYWLMITGLSPGEHTLEFGGIEKNGFSVHVTDHITVV